MSERKPYVDKALKNKYVSLNLDAHAYFTILQLRVFHFERIWVTKVMTSVRWLIFHWSSVLIVKNFPFWKLKKTLWIELDDCFLMIH